MAGLGLEQVFEQVSQAINKRLNKDIKRKLARNIIKQLKQNAAPVLKRRLLDAYDQLSSEGSYGSRSSGRDPLALENHRGLFEQQITKELGDISLDGETIVINIGNEEDWGFGETEGREGPPRTVDWLHFYIEGIIGEVGFIDRDMYLSRRTSAKTLGRMGDGFLITREQYEKEEWERATKIKFEDIIHPISGQSPYRGFHKAVENFDFSPYVSEAVKETFNNLGKSLV